MRLSESCKIDGLGTLLQANGDGSFDSGDINMISNYIRTIRGEGVCFLLDGYDEYLKPPDGYDRLCYKLNKTQNTAQVSCDSDLKHTLTKLLRLLHLEKQAYSHTWSSWSSPKLRTRPSISI